ncbi:MAG TPA: ABC transporter ATP-binding protein [Candidatus Limnocylindrales bacterium]|nr:ABC transporter ATP-binding protein [Candidatus Limnocylindrales bacterium]
MKVWKCKGATYTPTPPHPHTSILPYLYTSIPYTSLRSVLQVKNLVVNYGHVEALRGIDLQVEKGEIVAIIGSNGAGKTTTLNAIFGLIPKVQGTVYFKDVDISTCKPHEILRLGMSPVLQGRQIFADQTVYDNLLLGAYTRFKEGRDRITKLIEREYARFPILKERKNQMAGTLSGGQQQMLAISRALMSEPTFLLMDEPSMGLSPVMVLEIVKTIKALNQEGVTILLVEQMAAIALKIAHRAYVLERGKIALTGTGKELLQNPQVRKAYLGA